MLQFREQQEAFNYDNCQFSVSSSQVQVCRHLQPSILNKSSIHAVTLSDSNLTQLPTLPVDVQKIDLTRNSLTMLPLGLKNLKEIRVNNNLIQRIPQQINDLTALRIIRANNNNICIIPFLKYVRHLQLNHNPIKMITTKFSETRIQFLNFDWLPYLMNVAIQQFNQDIVYALRDIIHQANLDPLEQFVSFDILFQHRKLHYADISYPIYKAISKKQDFFIDYLLKFQRNINYNALLYFDKPILAQVFEQGFQKALQLFTLKKSNLNYPEVYMVNLLLTIKHHNLFYFNYLVGTGLKRHIIIDNQAEIIQTIFKTFQQQNNSVEMLSAILRYSSFNQNNKKIFHVPPNYSISQGQRICEGVLYVLRNQKINQVFDFNSAIVEDTLEPLLHFAMTNRKPELVKLILQKFQKPFVRNYAGKLARIIRGSIFSRKMVWKYQKLYIKELMKQKQVTQSEKKRISDSQKWMNVIYDEPKSKNIYSSPIQSASFQCNSLISSKIQSIQKSIQRKKMIKNFNIQQNQTTQIQQNQSLQYDHEEDQTGILFQFALNLGNGRSGNYFAAPSFKFENTMNSLSLYESYQKSALNTVQKEYQRATNMRQKERKPKSSFIVSPLKICQHIQQNQHQKQFILARENQSLNSNCYSPCINAFDSSRIVG